MIDSSLVRNKIPRGEGGETQQHVVWDFRENPAIKYLGSLEAVAVILWFADGAFFG